jgi:hypothetical protein
LFFFHICHCRTIHHTHHMIVPADWLLPRLYRTTFTHYYINGWFLKKQWHQNWLKGLSTSYTTGNSVSLRMDDVRQPTISEFFYMCQGSLIEEKTQIFASFPKHPLDSLQRCQNSPLSWQVIMHASWALIYNQIHACSFDWLHLR